MESIASSLPRPRVCRLLQRLILIVFMMFAHTAGVRAGECDALDIEITTTPVFSQFTLALHQHVAQMRQIPTGPIELMLVGDSLVWAWDTQAWGPEARGRSKWGFGVVGDRTQNLLWRLQSEELKKVKPQNVLLLMGTNNLGAVDKPCAILAGFDAVVRRMRELWSDFRLYVVLIPPRGVGWSDVDAERRVVNQELSQRAETENWAVIDADRELTCNFKQPCANYGPDLLHLTSAGYRVLSGIVTRALGWSKR